MPKPDNGTMSKSYDLGMGGKAASHGTGYTKPSRDALSPESYGKQYSGYGNYAGRKGGVSTQSTFGAASKAPAKPTGAVETFKVNDRVKHLKFGEGSILSVTPVGADTIYEIMFDDAGIKKLLATYAKLKKI